MNKNYFQFYETFLQVIEALPIDEQLKYFKAICRYGLYNEKPELEGKDLAVFLQIQFAIDNQNKRRSINRENGLRPKTENKRSNATENEANRKAERFSPPTLEEVKAYCKERDNKVNAEAFVNFYTSKNWYVGSNKMKDWRASVRTWEVNSFSKGKSVNRSVKDSLSNKDFADKYIDTI